MEVLKNTTVKQHFTKKKKKKERKENPHNLSS